MKRNQRPANTGGVMGKLYSYVYVSLDGVMASPEKWVSPYFSKELGEDLAQRLQSSTAMVLGRQTYTEFAAYWPQQGSDVPFADLNNNIRKYVVSKSLSGTSWNNSEVVDTNDLVRLRSRGNLHITGSSQLVNSLLASRQLDEIVLVVFPLVLGSGRRLFEQPIATNLELAEVKPFPFGALRLTYRAKLA